MAPNIAARFTEAHLQAAMRFYDIPDGQIVVYNRCYDD